MNKVKKFDFGLPKTTRDGIPLEIRFLGPEHGRYIYKHLQEKEPNRHCECHDCIVSEVMES